MWRKPGIVGRQGDGLVDEDQPLVVAVGPDAHQGGLGPHQGIAREPGAAFAQGQGQGDGVIGVPECGVGLQQDPQALVVQVLAPAGRQQEPGRLGLTGTQAREGQELVGLGRRREDVESLEVRQRGGRIAAGELAAHPGPQQAGVVRAADPAAASSVADASRRCP